MKYLNKSFSVSTFVRPSEESEMIKKGYEKRKEGYWCKSNFDVADMIPKECGCCHKTDLAANWDAPALDDWGVCKNCFIACFKGREGKFIENAIQLIATPEKFQANDDDIARAIKFINNRGAKRWVKNNWPEKYEVIYGG